MNIRKFLKDPKYVAGNYIFKRRPNLLPDRWYIEIMYKKIFGHKIDLRHPKTFNEKLQWLKLYDRNPLYTTLVDKYRVKQYVADKIGAEYVIPTLAVYNSVDEIDLDKLPNQFVLKCNHDSGSVAICRDKKTFDLEAAKKKLDKGLKQNFYLLAREWPYKNVKRCIIAEQYMEDHGGGFADMQPNESDLQLDESLQLVENNRVMKISGEGENPDGEIYFDNMALVDYKFFCFHGEPKVMYIGADKAKEPTSDFFDMEYNHLPIRMVDPNAEQIPPKPKEFEKLKELATILSKGIPHVRIDFYVVNGKIYFGEFTFYHMGGFSLVKPHEWNLKMGQWI